MTTTKLGLPTIDGTMTADVVRDMNALAQAVDDKAGAPSGLAILDANSSVPAAQLGNVPVKSVNGETGDVVIQTFSGNYNDLSNKPFIPDTPDDIGAEPVITTKKTAFNKDFGTNNGTVADGGVVAAHQADDVSHVKYGVATGTANTYAVTLDPTPTEYVEGMALSVKINVASTGASTINVNGLGAIPIKKANGTDVTNLKANGIYTLRYDGTNFILQGEGGSGNALASDLLSGKTASTDAGDITGTMPNRGTFNLALGATVPAGYYSGGTVPNGKRTATGTATSGSTAQSTYDQYGNLASNVYSLSVSGLSFKPSCIVVKYSGGAILGVYSSGIINSGHETAVGDVYNGYIYAIDYGAFYVSSGSFCFPLSSNGRNRACDWIAYEE